MERHVSGREQYFVLSSHRSRARRNSQKKPKTGSSWCLAKLWMWELPRQDQTLTLQPALNGCTPYCKLTKKSELRRKKRLNKEASTFRGSVVQNNKPASVGSWHQTWVCHCVDYEPDGIQKHGADDRSRWLRPTRRQIEWMWYKQMHKKLSSNCSEYPPLVKLYISYIYICICYHWLWGAARYSCT